MQALVLAAALLALDGSLKTLTRQLITLTRTLGGTQTVLEIYTNLTCCDEFVGLSRSERYFATLNHRWCFLPLFWPFTAEAGRQLPVPEMGALIAAVRRSTRVLWALHVTLQEVRSCASSHLSLTIPC